MAKISQNFPEGKTHGSFFGLLSLYHHPDTKNN